MIFEIGLKILKNKIVILGIFLLMGRSVHAQIGGISGSKISAVCVQVVENKKVEFEPGLAYGSSKYFWDSHSALKHIGHSPDSLMHLTEMYFRVTYGLWNKVELGATVSTELSTAKLGMRYVVLQNKKFGFATIAGLDVPLGNGTVNQAIRTSQNTMAVGAGLVASFQFNENLSLDVNVQGQSFLREIEEKNKGTFYFNSDLGYYVFSHQLQLIAGVGYRYSKFENLALHLFTMYPGITVETGKNYILVLSYPFDVYGKNAVKSSGVNFALTLTFE